MMDQAEVTACTKHPEAADTLVGSRAITKVSVTGGKKKAVQEEAGEEGGVWIEAVDEWMKELIQDGGGLNAEPNFSASIPKPIIK